MSDDARSLVARSAGAHDAAHSASSSVRWAR